MDKPQSTPPASYVYFIQHGEYGPVKIGVAVDPLQRRRELQTGNPEQLHIRAMVPGAHDLEGQLHRRFAEWHIQGEWFGGGDWSAAILAFAAGLRDEHEVLEGTVCAEGGLEYIGKRIEPISTKDRLDLRYDIERLWLRRFNPDEIAEELDHYWGLSEDEIKAEIKEMRKSSVWDVGKRPVVCQWKPRNDAHLRDVA